MNSGGTHAVPNTIPGLPTLNYFVTQPSSSRSRFWKVYFRIVCLTGCPLYPTAPRSWLNVRAHRSEQAVRSLLRHKSPECAEQRSGGWTTVSAEWRSCDTWERQAEARPRSLKTLVGAVRARAQEGGCVRARAGGCVCVYARAGGCVRAYAHSATC